MRCINCQWFSEAHNDRGGECYYNPRGAPFIDNPKERFCSKFERRDLQADLAKYVVCGNCEHFFPKSEWGNGECTIKFKENGGYAGTTQNSHCKLKGFISKARLK